MIKGLQAKLLLLGSLLSVEALQTQKSSIVQQVIDAKNKQAMANTFALFDIDDDNEDDGLDDVQDDPSLSVS